MSNHKAFRLTLLAGGPLGIGLIVVGFFLPRWHFTVMTAGFVTLALVFVIAQTLAVCHMFKHDEDKRKASMRDCPTCGKPIYNDDTVCPYCQSEVKK